MVNNRITWDNKSDKAFYQGIDRGMFYIPGASGLPWNGLTSVAESSPDPIMTQIYQDGEKVFIYNRGSSYEAKIEAFSYPPDFEPYYGARPGANRPFSFAYRVMTSETTYELHLLYNVVAVPDDVVYSTISEAIDPTMFSWTFTTRPVNIQGKARSSHIILDSAVIHSWTLEELEAQLYGGEGVIPHMPTPAEVEAIFQANAILVVVDNGDGTATISGPDEAIAYLTADRVRISWPSVTYLTEDKRKISSF